MTTVTMQMATIIVIPTIIMMIMISEGISAKQGNDETTVSQHHSKTFCPQLCCAYPQVEISIHYHMYVPSSHAHLK